MKHQGIVASNLVLSYFLPGGCFVSVLVVGCVCRRYLFVVGCRVVGCRVLVVGCRVRRLALTFSVVGAQL